MDLAHRFVNNPLLSPSDLKPSAEGMNVECLLNPGVFRFQNKTWLLIRVAERPEQTLDRTSFPVLDGQGGVRILQFDNNDPLLDRTDPRIISYAGKGYLTTMSHLRLMSSTDGVHFEEPQSGSIIFGDGELETYGIEDCRVARIGSTYYLSFTQVSEHGVGVGLKSTRDWHSLENCGMIFPPHNKDCALFEEKVNGLYLAFHRPSSPNLGGNFIWLAESSDLHHWGNHRCVAHTRDGRWDSARVGAGASPIRTDRGWLEIYHGADSKNRYCLGALLLDLEKPWKVIARSAEPIMEPIASYEQTGFFGHVVFTNGHLINGDELTIYYGASDSVVCAANFSITEVLDSLHTEEVNQA